MRSKRLFSLPILFLLALAGNLPAWTPEYTALQSFFERVTRERYDHLFDNVKSLDDWQVRRSVIKSGLDRMFGFDRTWPAAPPKVTVTHRVERPDYTLECLVLEAAPGLYFTANLYLPKEGRKPYPFIIYQSGHSPNGPWGNKTKFKHHGAWFASRGIAVLIMDTIESGELKVTHHGLWYYAWYDWFSRGFSPLSVEIFNARRAIDYLVTRPELDPTRIGATGISGGGVCTFFLTLLDDRVTAAAPVSGECSTVGHVCDRLAVEHCDCMYPINGRGYLFSEMGALAAPRAFLMCNSTEDGLFPMPAFGQLVEKMRQVYALYDAADSLTVATAPGGHADKESIRLPVYRFFLHEFLGRDEDLTREGPVDTIPDAELLCFRKGFPTDERLTRVHEDYMAHRGVSVPENWNQADRASRRAALISALRSEVFTRLPVDSPMPQPEQGEVSRMWGRSIRNLNYKAFPELTVAGKLSLPTEVKPGVKIPGVLLLEDGRGPSNVSTGRSDDEGYDWGGRAVLTIETLDTRSRTLDDSLVHHMRREANIAGYSFDEIRVYEILQGLRVLRALPGVDPEKVSIVGRGAMGINGLYAALLDGKVEHLALEDPTASHLEGPYYLQVLPQTDIPEVVALMADKVRLWGDIPPQITQALRKLSPPQTILRNNLAECLE